MMLLFSNVRDSAEICRGMRRLQNVSEKVGGLLTKIILSIVGLQEPDVRLTDASCGCGLA